VRKRGLLAGALILVVALSSGCVASKEAREGADGLRERLGTPSWASSVEVESGRDGQGNDYVQTTVTLKDSATPAEVSSFVVALPEESEQAGLGDGISLREYLSFVSPSAARLDVEWRSSIVADEVTRAVTEWFGVADVLGSSVAASARTDGGASYVVSLGEGPSSAVHDTYDSLASLAQPDTAWQVAGTSGALSLDLSGSVLPTADQLAMWDALLAALDKLPTDLPPSVLSLHFLEHTVADVAFLTPDDVTAESMTIEAYGDLLWPVFKPQLEAMSALPEAWSYFADWAPVSSPTSRSSVISLLSDQEPTDNGDETTRWSRAAKHYVNGL